MIFTLAIIIIVLAVLFDFTNGFHDAANAIAACITTRALPPKVALIMAASMNLLGAMLGTAVASTIAKKIVSTGDLGSTEEGLVVVLGAILAAIIWNILTWWFGLPSSSSHALIGGLAGAGFAVGGFDVVHWSSIGMSVIVPMFLSPIVGITLASSIVAVINRACKNVEVKNAYKGFRRAQIFSSAAIALGHGLQDAQKTMGIIFLAATTAGIAGLSLESESIPLWIKLTCALAISAGTLVGGFKVIKTLGQKIIEINPPRGFAAELTGASVLMFTSFVWHAPVSTTHVITSAIIGAGLPGGYKKVRWKSGVNIIRAWVSTLPAGFALGFLITYVINIFL
jgi:PiT family inorganic phosphate transporter